MGCLVLGSMNCLQDQLGAHYIQKHSQFQTTHLLRMSAGAMANLGHWQFRHTNTHTCKHTQTHMHTQGTHTHIHLHTYTNTRCAQMPACLQWHSIIREYTQVESLLLVGDPQQLPPTVRSHSAEKLGLGTSLFLRLQTMGLKPMLLDTQYR